MTAGGGGSPVEASVTVTRGSLGNPGSSDSPGGWEAAGRIGVKPAVGLEIGVSAARGSFLARSLDPLLAGAAGNRSPRETALGADVEYSRGYWLVRAELVAAWRQYPVFQAPYLPDSLGAAAVDVEGRYRIRPGLYLAARAGHMTFGTIVGSAGPVTWDAPVSQFEAGAGFSPTRNVLVKVTGQYHRRDTVKSPSLALGAIELGVRF